MSTNGAWIGMPKSITRHRRKEIRQARTPEPDAYREVDPGDIKSRRPEPLIEAACRRGTNIRITVFGSAGYLAGL